jgi:HAD superfamily hydrolase (TIGR01509 family)
MASTRNALDAVIFDVDGTLVDSVDLHARCWRRAFARFGKELELEAVRSQIGKGGDQLLPMFLDHYEMNRIGDELDDYRARLWRRSYMDRVVAFPKVRELLERIHRDGLRIAVASSAKEDELAWYLGVADIETLVDIRISADDATHSKPRPDIFRAALGDLRIQDPSRALVVGDTPWDAIAARRAGLETVGVLCGGWDADTLRREGCIAIYVDPEDLLHRYDDSPLRLPRKYREGTAFEEIVP